MALLSFLLILFTGIVLVTGMMFPFQYGKMYRGYKCRKPFRNNLIVFNNDHTFLYIKDSAEPLHGTWKWNQISNHLDLVYNYQSRLVTQQWAVLEERGEYDKIQVVRLNDQQYFRNQVLSSSINGFNLIDDSSEASSSNQPIQNNLDTDIAFDDDLQDILDSFQCEDPNAAKLF